MRRQQIMVDLRKFISTIETPQSLEGARGQRLWDTEEPATLLGISDTLVQAASIIVDHKIAIALGYETNNNSMFYSGAEIDWVMRIVEPMIKTVQQTKKLEVENHKQVLSLLSRGRVNIDEAKGLLEMLDKKMQLDLMSAFTE